MELAGAVTVKWKPAPDKGKSIFYAQREYEILWLEMQVFDPKAGKEPCLVLAPGGPILPRILPLRFIENIESEKRTILSKLDLEP